jgi:hypothetical protein
MRIGSIVIHYFEFKRMVAFWQEALHYIPREQASNDWMVLRDPKGRGRLCSVGGSRRESFLCRSQAGWTFNLKGNKPIIGVLDCYSAKLNVTPVNLVVLAVKTFPIWKDWLELVCHEATRKMRVGPSESACRNGFQTTLSYCGKEPKGSEGHPLKGPLSRNNIPL